ncbi:hypothetical protein [Bradyrhizobium sp. CCBAU 53380]|nr:hypothetical protein [Bradyrhizobium sp. CCBAU 53380]
MIETETLLEKCPVRGLAHGREPAADVVSAAEHPVQVPKVPR